MVAASRYRNTVKLCLVCLGLILIVACGPRDKYIGTYRAVAQALPKSAETVMELRAAGNGILRMGDEEASFSWHVKGRELRVHTKEGGVIAGMINNNAIYISFDGTTIICFKKIH